MKTLALVIALIVLTATAALATCTTQTIIVGGKVQIWSVCCFNGNCTMTCLSGCN